ncbi:MAG: hypothetical protein KBG21_00725 [Ignavibacteria bacterium]|nr:hypothetical protein [Ignavibacteria bacterium]
MKTTIDNGTENKKDRIYKMGPDDCSFNSINNFISNCKVEDGKQKVQ